MADGPVGHQPIPRADLPVRPDSGTLLRRLGLAEFGSVLHLAFSPDGSLLAASGQAGLRIYARDQAWAEIARDQDYAGPSHGAAFAPDGRLATTSDDGKVRLYAGALMGNIRPVATATPVLDPYGAAFSPDGGRLLIGDYDQANIAILDGHRLASLPQPDLRGIGGGNLALVTWARDGRTLFAAGRYASAYPDTNILAWTEAIARPRRSLQAGRNAIVSLAPLAGGDLLVAAMDPWLARLSAEDGSARWVHGPPQADLRDQQSTFSVSSDGTMIDFRFPPDRKELGRFDLRTRTLSLDPARDGRTNAPRQAGLAVEGWDTTTKPTLAGQRLNLEPYEVARSFAVNPSGDRFVLGTEWALRAFRADATQVWTRSSPGPVRAVNITADGRLVVAAYADGTIRWHRMSDGVELLAFMPFPDRTNWVAWTPEGFYAATAGAHGILRWHVNRGWDQAADSVPIKDIPGSFRPEMLPLVLQELETPRALGLAVLTEHNREVQRRTHSQIPPGTKLHLLAVGISAYNEEYAKTLRLNYAERDANDLASAIVNTQGSLYAKVLPQLLADKDATKSGILDALAAMRDGMERGSGNDVAVVHFSGHGALIDGRLYLLPVEVDARNPARIKATALSADDLRSELLELAKHGRVLVLLDACHSGATTANGAALDVDSTALRATLAAPNVTVLTSSRGHEPSREDASWGHGAFTKTLLDALSDPAADLDRTGLISTNGLAHYLAQHVPSLTSGAQTPDMEIRYEGTIFATTF